MAPWALASPIPLGDAANVPLVDDIAGDGIGGWTDQGAENSLSGFPSGKVTFEGLPFVIPPGESNAAVAFQILADHTCPRRFRFLLAEQ